MVWWDEMLRAKQQRDQAGLADLAHPAPMAALEGPVGVLGAAGRVRTPERMLWPRIDTVPLHWVYKHRLNLILKQISCTSHVDSVRFSNKAIDPGGGEGTHCNALVFSRLQHVNEYIYLKSTQIVL